MIIPNFGLLVLNYFWTPQYHPPKANKFIGATGRADFHGYTRFVVNCMWFVGQGSASLYSFFAGGSFTAAIQ